MFVNSYHPISIVLFLLISIFNHCFIIVIFKVSILNPPNSKFYFYYHHFHSIMTIFTHLIFNFNPLMYLSNFINHPIFQFTTAN